MREEQSTRWQTSSVASSRAHPSSGFPSKCQKILLRLLPLSLISLPSPSSMSPPCHLILHFLLVLRISQFWTFTPSTLSRSHVPSVLFASTKFSKLSKFDTKEYCNLSQTLLCVCKLLITDYRFIIAIYRWTDKVKPRSFSLSHKHISKCWVLVQLWMQKIQLFRTIPTAFHGSFDCWSTQSCASDSADREWNSKLPSRRLFPIHSTNKTLTHFSP